MKPEKTTTGQIKAHSAVAIKGNKVVAQIYNLETYTKIKDVVYALKDGDGTVVVFESKSGRTVKVVR